tara:strand:- start:83 stop:451 length:369 start_codon:yes stop_codon:yes gene_type:complete
MNDTEHACCLSRAAAGSGQSTEFHAMDFNSSTMQGVDIDFDPISESEIEDLVGNAASELQELIAGLSLSVKQILKIMSKVLGETADYLVLISDDLMESASLCLDQLLSSDDESLMALCALCA